MCKHNADTSNKLANSMGKFNLPQIYFVCNFSPFDPLPQKSVYSPTNTNNHFGQLPPLV